MMHSLLVSVVTVGLGRVIIFDNPTDPLSRLGGARPRVRKSDIWLCAKTTSSTAHLATSGPRKGLGDGIPAIYLSALWGKGVWRDS